MMVSAMAERPETEKLLHLAGVLAAVSGVFTVISLVQKHNGRRGA